MNCEETRAQLDALFVGDAMRRPMAARGHLRQCDRCRGWFNELVSVERALGIGDEAESFERRFSDAVVYAAAEQASTPEPQGIRAIWDRLRERWASAAMATAAVAACVGAAFALAPLLQTAAPETDGFAARSASGASMDEDKVSRRGVHQIEIFCVERGAMGVQIREADKVSGTLTCPLGGELKFAYVNQSLSGERPLANLTLVGVDRDGRALWYRPVVPEEASMASVAVAEAAQTVLLGQTIRLSVNHKPGRVSVFGIFSATPLPRAPLDAWLANGADPDMLDGVAIRDARGGRALLGSQGDGEYVLSVRALKISEESEGAQ